MTRSIFLVLLVLVGWPGLARAHSGTPYTPLIGGFLVQCMSPVGQPVAFVPNSSLADVGLAFPEWPGVPAHVEYNPALLARLPPWMQLHQVLALPHSEETADCWSLQLLKHQRLVSRAEVLALQSSFAGELPVPWSDRPDPMRARRFLECYDRTVGASVFDDQTRFRAQLPPGVSQPGSPVGPGAREEYLGVRRWRFCSHIPGVSAPTSSGHVSQGSCERARARLREGDAGYVVSECVLTSSERCSAGQGR